MFRSESGKLVMGRKRLNFVTEQKEDQVRMIVGQLLSSKQRGVVTDPLNLGLKCL